MRNLAEFAKSYLFYSTRSKTPWWGKFENWWRRNLRKGYTIDMKIWYVIKIAKIYLCNKSTCVTYFSGLRASEPHPVAT